MIIERGLGVESFMPTSFVDRHEFYSRMVAGVCQAHPLAIQKHKLGAPGIPQLLALKCPHAVISRVAKFIIFTLKCMQRACTWTHVSKEVFKGAPSLTHRDPAPTVVFVLGAHRVSGPTDHALPCRVFRCSSRPTTMTVTEVVGHAMTAGYCFAGSQLRRRYYAFLTALTETDPVNAVKGSWRTTNNGEVVECLTGQIKSFHKSCITQVEKGAQL